MYVQFSLLHVYVEIFFIYEWIAENVVIPFIIFPKIILANNLTKFYHNICDHIISISAKAARYTTCRFESPPSQKGQNFNIFVFQDKSFQFTQDIDI